MPGFEGKPSNLKKNIIEASGGSTKATEYLKNAGRRGAQTREDNRMKHEEMRRSRFNEVYAQELERLKEVEGEIRPIEELEEEAEKIAAVLVIREMKEKQGQLEEKLRIKKELRQS